ncbi:hypothetical protein [Geodermatophilus marinus]|uniref:hypothetical protein n=1 Tax=Geodermatophilus sp. LHW52908 TaxID=2303986 RepID=UPI000E3C3D7A|nr:hypothetical protein [Geodermatophilus sp. LHW52908]RFU21273.1 hypothetical protein D0Z06_10825 [Geodermatophilus sp. LHW52908]
MSPERSTAPAQDLAARTHVDFDLHGIVGIRILDPRARDVETITSQIGPLVAPLAREPDITVRFVDQLPGPPRMTYAGWPDAAAAGDEFLLLRGADGVAARTSFPIDAIGDRCDIVCERRVGPVPHLLAIINLTALTKGVLPLHASAFTYRGEGVLATGWSKGGKTETLLAFAARGAHYIGDEWVYLTPDGGLHGVPEPIRLWYWQVAQLPGVRAALSRASRARLRAMPSIASSATAMADRLHGVPSSVLRRAAPVVRRQANVQVPPAQLFGAEAVALHGQLDHLLLVASHDGNEVTIEPVSGAEIAARMRASLAEERTPFLQVYRQFRFLFPHRRATVVEDAPAVEGGLLDDYLGDRPAHALRHPYPVDLRSLVDPVESLLRSTR